MAERLIQSDLVHSKNINLAEDIEDNFNGLLDTALLPWANIKERKLMSGDNFDFSKDIFDSLDHNEISLISSEAIQRIMGATKNHFSRITDAIVQYYNDEISYNDLKGIAR